jgi:hypothetical protein
MAPIQIRRRDAGAGVAVFGILSHAAALNGLRQSRYWGMLWQPEANATASYYKRGGAMSCRAKLLLISVCAAMLAGCNPPKQPKPSPTPIPKSARGTSGVKAPALVDVGGHRLHSAQHLVVALCG